MGPISWMLVILFATWLYFLPSYLGRKLHHPSEGTIVLLNLLFGWTVILWFFLCIWAVSPSLDRWQSHSRRLNW